MKGQRLFVRPATPDDDIIVRELWATSDTRPQQGTETLLGKLAGSCVAALNFDLSDDAIVLRDLVVAPELRKKRVGSGMLIELARLGRSLGKIRIVTHLTSCPFFLKTGFTDEGGLLQRSIEGE
ncbi:MAG TPA: GNAT family N-acetyltransferase [Thermoanaerobaculia bacterium]|nr:GNAT family N-acetyltransferase [Thermoanaerobaculia bacterium]